MIYHNGQKLDKNTDQQVLWEIVVDEDIDIPFEEYADGDISNATIIEYIENWIEAGDEMGTVQEKSLSY